MPPTPPSSRDDSLDFDGLGLKPADTKAKASESDFEKELEALFAEELASSDERPASAPPVGAPAFEEDALLLEDLVDDVKPLSAMGKDEDILDLSAFSAGGDLELTPPEDVSGGTNGTIDLGGLDDLISSLGETKKAAPASAAPLGNADMADLLETLDLAKADAKADADEGLLDLSLSDLLEEPAPAKAPAAPAADLQDLTLPDFTDPEPGRDLVAEQEQADTLDASALSLEDLVETPAPAAPAFAAPAPAVAAASVEQVLDSGELDMTGLMEGIETAAGEPAPELSLDPRELLAQISDAPSAPAFELMPKPVALAEPVAEPVVMAPPVVEPVAVPEPLVAPLVAPPAAEAAPVAEAAGPSLSDAALGLAAAGAVAAIAAAAVSQSAAPAAAPKPLALLAAPAPEGVVAPPAVPASGRPMVPPAALANFSTRLNQLALQVNGSKRIMTRLEEQLCARDKALAVMEERLLSSQNEAKALRDELSSLRSLLEGSLGLQVATTASERAQAATDKVELLAQRLEGASAQVNARLEHLEGRQTKLDSEVLAEITRAVPREAAKVIREEIAHLAASMKDE